jgi:acyl-CoA thioesterase-1
MTRWALLALLASLTVINQPAHAEGCPVPDTFTISPADLPATKVALAKGTLTVLALGGASTLGGPAKGAQFTYPARLEARLREAFPKVSVTVAVRAVARESDASVLTSLEASLSSVKPSLVIWGPGGSAAARGDDLDTFLSTIGEVIGQVRLADTDLILMTLQYAPSVSRLVNLGPYRMAVLRGGNDAGVPVLDRYELMRFWSDNDFLNLDATNVDDRIHVSRTLYDCMAEILANAIVDATK